MIYRKQGNIHWLEFELLSNERLKHGVFLRNSKHAAKDILGISAISVSKQCHGKDVAYFADNKEVMVCDALVTDTKGLGLMISHADCQAAIFYDPINHVLANVHSGWRGSVQNIYAETVNFLQKKHGTQASDLLVAISPSLGPQNAQFINYKQELPEAFWQFQIKPEYFDFWAISRWQLEGCGILPHHIQIAELDTFADPEKFFSYRRDKTSERNGTIAALS